MDSHLDKKSKKVIKQINKELFEQPLKETVTFSDNLENMLESCTHNQLTNILSHYAVMLKITVEQINTGIVPLNVEQILKITGWNPLDRSETILT